MLQGVDFSELTIDVICVEATNSVGQAKKNKGVKDLLTGEILYLSQRPRKVDIQL